MDVTRGPALTESPQAKLPPQQPFNPLDRRKKDLAEQLSQIGDDIRVNWEFSCNPHDETSIAVNPLQQNNLVAGANDYRLGWGTSGVYASTDDGLHWYPAIIPFPSLPNG